MGYSFTDFNGMSTKTPGDVTSITVYYGDKESDQTIITGDNIVTVEGLLDYQQGPSSLTPSTSLRSANIYPTNKTITLWIKDQPGATLFLQDAIYGADRVLIKYKVTHAVTVGFDFWGYVSAMERVITNATDALFKISFVADGVQAPVRATEIKVSATRPGDMLVLRPGDQKYKYLKNISFAKISLKFKGGDQEFPTSLPAVKVISGGSKPLSLFVFDSPQQDLISAKNGADIMISSDKPDITYNDSEVIVGDQKTFVQTLVWALPWLDQTSKVIISPVPSGTEAALFLTYQTDFWWG